jgi:hypothetical protein
MYTFYTTLKDVFGDEVHMLLFDPDFCLQFFLDDFATDLNRDPSMRDWFDFSEIPANHITSLRAHEDPMH